ncbi:hypothetical protein BGX33_002508 [Mortierella sp. NVP41]|nr:hypothetical protein BGX33_002508 [Mortierella sp. NVP41]
MLQSCPHLCALTLHRTTVFIGCLPRFAHTGIKTLAANLASIFVPDDVVASASPEFKILSCFQAVHLENISNWSASLLLLDVFEGLSEIRLSYKDITAAAINATLMHSSTFRTLAISPDDAPYWKTTIVSTDRDHFKDWRRLVQLIPQLCTEFRPLIIPQHWMSIDDLEATTRACTELEVLHVRIEGLDSSTKVAEKTRLWNLRRRQNSDICSLMVGRKVRRELRAAENTLEGCVPRYLIQIESLHDV